MPKDSACLTCEHHIHCVNAEKSQSAKPCSIYNNCGIIIDTREQEVGVRNGKIVCWLAK